PRGGFSCSSSCAKANAAWRHSRVQLGWAAGVVLAQSDCRVGSRFVSESNEEICPHWAFPLDVNDPPLLERKRRCEAKVRPLGHLNGAGYSMRFHPAGGVDRIAPQVIDELLVS